MTRTALATPDGPDDRSSQEVISALAAAAFVSCGALLREGSLTRSQKITQQVLEDVDLLCPTTSSGSIEHTMIVVKSALNARYKVPWYARVSPQQLAGLAVFIAGRERAAVRCEWRAHLSGETGTGLPSRRQAREAAGFVLAAVRYRFQDLTDLAWRPVDTLLASRELSSLTVVLATLITVVFFLRRGGQNDLADHLDSVAVVSAFALAAIHGGRRYRQVKPPKRKPRSR
jgi:hypothetical protein